MAESTQRLVYDTRRERVLLFGGFGENGPLNDLWEWDGERRPLGRGSGSGSPDSQRPRDGLRPEQAGGRFHGGLHSGETYSDTWEWDGWVRPVE